MRMRIFVFASLAALVLLALAPAAAQDSQAGGSEKIVPFKAFFITHPEVIGEENGIQTLSIPGEGHATHLGKTEMDSISTVDLNVFPFAQEGPMTLIAANGDVLEGYYAGTAIPLVTGGVSFGGTWEFTGGSGRFAGAAGSGVYWGTALVDGQLFFDGVLVKR